MTIDLSKYNNSFLGQEVTDEHPYQKDELGIDKISSKGLLSEQIFGPNQDYMCQCRKIIGKYNDGITCPKCNVLCGPSELRFHIFGRINLVFPVVRPTRKKQIIAKILKQKNKNLILTYKAQTTKSLHRYLNIYKEKISIIDKVLDSKKGSITIPLRITGIYSLYLSLLFAARYLQNSTAKYFIDNNIFIKELKVIPPNVRPIIINTGNTKKIFMTDITKNYISIVKKNSSNKSFEGIVQQGEEEILKKIEINLQSPYFEEIIDECILHYDIMAINIQKSINELYHTVSETISGKTGIIRNEILSKTVEFSARSPIIVGPELPPWKIKVSRKILFKLWYPYFLNFLAEVKGYDYDYCFNMFMTTEHEYTEGVKPLFDEFLKWFQK